MLEYPSNNKVLVAMYAESDAQDMVKSHRWVLRKGRGGGGVLLIVPAGVRKHTPEHDAGGSGSVQNVAGG